MQMTLLGMESLFSFLHIYVLIKCLVNCTSVVGKRAGCRILLLFQPESEMNGREEVDSNRFRKKILSFIGYREK